MDNIAGSAEVHDEGDRARRESFEDDARTVVANGWKYHDVRGSQALQDFRVTDPATKRNSLVDPKRSR